MMYYETELLEKLRSFYKTNIHSYNRENRCNQGLLYNIQNREIVCLDYDASIRGFY